MKSTKYQLLKDDYDFVCRQLKEYKKLIDQLIEENANLKCTIKKFTYVNNFKNLTSEDIKESMEATKKAMED